ncbi:hypothetical protein K7432_004798 [Basidiobolus ranarum]|uniref:Nitrogen regulatory protein areA GATA-like domain-containing protein n=1 Tax=Basidiobolus ranarum TaxID=34480 RepID=A0ABR2WXT8_9FUNG
MPGILSEPVLTLALDNIHKLREIDCDNLYSMWAVFAKCKENLLNGQRLENISWRLWFRQSTSEREFGRKSTSVTGLEACSRSAPTPGSDLIVTLNNPPQQFSSPLLHKLSDSISTGLELAGDDTNSFSSTLDKLNLNQSSVEKQNFHPIRSIRPRRVESVSNLQPQVVIKNSLDNQEPETVSEVAPETPLNEDRKRKIFFIAESLGEESYIEQTPFIKSKNSRTVMDLQALAHFPADSSLEFSVSNDSESIISGDEGWESVASSYQSTSSSSDSRIFEKIQVPKQVSQYEPSKPSLLSTLFQKCSSTSIPYSKPSLFRDLCALSALDNEYDPLATELSESLHQNVLWQRQQHEHFCRPCQTQQSSTGFPSEYQDNFVTSPGYNGCGW